MDDLLRNTFLNQIKSLKGDDFEEFIKEFYLILDGADNYIPTRVTKDKGADGIRKSEKMVIAVYGPDTYHPGRFKTKVESDFEKYVTNYQTDYPNWGMMINHDPAPDQIAIIMSLKSDGVLMGVSQIMAIINNDLKDWQRRKLADFLGITPDVYRSDYLRAILEDLLKGGTSETIRDNYDKPLYIVDKIELNYSQEEVDGAKAEYENVLDCIVDIQSLLSGYSDDQLDIIKYKIVSDHNKYTGSFKQKLQSQTETYLEKYANQDDDAYLFYIRAVLFYYFEQCRIGIKTIQENDSTPPGK